MEVKHIRIHTGENHTKSLFYIDHNLMCCVLEDGFNEEKVYGETRIPEGKRNITLRTEGGMHERYLERYGSEFHKGMLWIRDVENFEYVYIHVGNKPKDTLGCLLTNQIMDCEAETMSTSRKAYEKIYPIIADAILSGEEVTIETKTIEL